ncbi:MAG: DUF2332 domain-containing protein [Ideonella sp.]|nr:DUF2332 domain-containing protein [Ideonella sp.]
MNTADISALLREFGQHHCPEEPLYQRLCTLLADMPKACTWLAAAPPTQRKANLLLAALHDQVLAAPSALGAWYASAKRAGPLADPYDPGLAQALANFLQAHASALAHTVQHRSTQTNEVGRCAVLWLVLQDLALSRQQAHPEAPQRLALFDLGCSAGLNLGLPWMDLHFHHHGGQRQARHAGVPIPERSSLAPALHCDIVGPWPAFVDSPTAFTLSHRAGVDPALIAVTQAEAVRWLQACLWPSDTTRRQRLEAAVALACAQPAELHQAASGPACLHLLEDWLSRLPSDTLPVVFNSWVLYYADEPALAAHRQALLSLMGRNGAVWISAEDLVTSTTLFGAPPPMPPLEGVTRDQAHTQTFWVTAHAGSNGLQARYVARSHPHGQWVKWEEVSGG